MSKKAAGQPSSMVAPPKHTAIPPIQLVQSAHPLRGRNILSFAIFQIDRNDSRALGLYHRSIPAVIRSCMTLAPSWSIVIHHDVSLLEHPYGRALVAAARCGLLELRLMPQTDELCKAMLWRMRPCWFDDANIVACRDADALFLARDRVSLEAFVASDSWAHNIADNVAHDASLMGGMSAYRVAPFRSLFPGSWDDFVAQAGPVNWKRHGEDQIFLHHHVWAKVAQHTLQHRICGTPTSDLPVSEIRDVPREVMLEADTLAPYVGVSGFNVERAIEFYDKLPQTESLRSIELQSEINVDRHRSVVISTDLNHDYFFFLPIVTALWTRRIGFDVQMLLTGDSLSWQADPRAWYALGRAMEIGAKPSFVTAQGYRSSTIAQTSRLLGFLACPESHYVLTSDVDMWPFDREWLSQQGRRFTCLFSNAYGGEKWPICYLGGSKATWREIMTPSSDNISEALQNLLDSNLSREANSDTNWNFDEYVFARKLRAWSGCPHECHMVPRGTDRRGMARIDRCETNEAGWLPPSSIDPYIDSHVGRPGYSDSNWSKYLPVLRMALGKEWADWFEKYRSDFLAIQRA